MKITFLIFSEGLALQTFLICYHTPKYHQVTVL